MMYYTRNKPKQIEYERIDEAVMHAVNFLDLPDVQVNIDFKKLDCVAANIDYQKDEMIVEIQINKNIWREDYEFEKTIFHELAHAKQIIDGRLDTSYPSKWNGIIYTCSYYDLPWEKEAYALEEEMISAFEAKNMKRGAHVLP